MRRSLSRHLKLMSVSVNNILQTVREIRVFDFLRIGRADRAYDIRHFNRAFHKINVSVKLHVRSHIPGKPEQAFKSIHAEYPLIFYVVDGENSFNAAEFFVAVIHSFKENYRSCRLPVVTMQNVGINIHSRDGVERGAREKREPFAVVVKTIILPSRLK